MPISAPEPLLRVAGLTAGYGKIGVLHGIDMTVQPGEIVALLGPNGAGKTTLLCALSGLIPIAGGSAVFDGHDTKGCGILMPINISTLITPAIAEELEHSARRFSVQASINRRYVPPSVRV